MCIDCASSDPMLTPHGCIPLEGPPWVFWCLSLYCHCFKLQPCYGVIKQLIELWFLFFSLMVFFFKCISFESRLQNLNSNPAPKISMSHFSVLGMDVFWMTLVQKKKKKPEEEIVKPLSEYQQNEFQWCQKSWPQEASPMQNVRKTYHSIRKQKGGDVACTVVENEWTLAPLIHHLLDKVRKFCLEFIGIRLTRILEVTDCSYYDSGRLPM